MKQNQSVRTFPSFLFPDKRSSAPLRAPATFAHADYVVSQRRSSLTRWRSCKPATALKDAFIVRGCKRESRDSRRPSWPSYIHARRRARAPTHNPGCLYARETRNSLYGKEVARRKERRDNRRLGKKGDPREGLFAERKTYTSLPLAYNTMSSPLLCSTASGAKSS